MISSETSDPEENAFWSEKDRLEHRDTLRILSGLGNFKLRLPMGMGLSGANDMLNKSKDTDNLENSISMRFLESVLDKVLNKSTRQVGSWDIGDVIMVSLPCRMVIDT